MLTSFYIQCRSPSQEGSSLGCSKWLRLLLEVHLGMLKGTGPAGCLWCSVIFWHLHHVRKKWHMLASQFCLDSGEAIKLSCFFEVVQVACTVESCWILRKQAPNMIFHTPGPCSMANAQFIYDTLWPSMVGNPAFACFCMESCCFPKQSIDSVDAAIADATCTDILHYFTMFTSMAFAVEV